MIRGEETAFRKIRNGLNQKNLPLITNATRYLTKARHWAPVDIEAELRKRNIDIREYQQALRTHSC